MLYYFETVIIPFIKDKISARLFLDILSIAFKDILNAKLNLDIIIKSQYQLMRSLIEKIDNINDCYLEIMFARGQIDLNVNLGLLLEHLAIKIYQGVN